MAENPLLNILVSMWHKVYTPSKRPPKTLAELPLELDTLVKWEVLSCSVDIKLTTTTLEYTTS